MLWDVVYEFFVKYIFGGLLLSSDGYIRDYQASCGLALFEEDYTEMYTSNFYGINVNTMNDGYQSLYYYSLGNYLSLIATIISMVVLVLICCALIKKIYNICAHIIG